MKLKKFLIFFTFYFLLTHPLKSEQYKIIVSINDKIITNLDLKNEIEILKILNDNPNLKYSQIYNLALNGLIDFKIKQIETDKNKINIENEIVEKYFEIFLKNSQFKRENISEFRINLIKEKIKEDLAWNKLISNLYTWKVNINMNEIESRIDNILKKEKNQNNAKEIKSQLINEETNKKLNVFSRYHFFKVKKEMMIKYY